MNGTNNKVYQYLIALIVIVSVLALFGDVMEPDSSLYASIAKNMILRNDWSNLYVRGVDWLDKPHLTFWLAALSFKVFGISAFAYKLPSFLFGLMGAWYLYQFAKDLFDKQTGLISALIFLSATHILVSTFDVRAEVYITTFTLAAIYHYYKAHQHSFWHVVAGSFAAACAIMIKGIFVLIPVFAGFIIYWLLTKQLKQLLKIKWWIAVVLIFIFIIPELYTLYIQWDLHPEKLFFGKQHTSGIKFFFWDSQFGRFFNNGPIKGKGDLSFFLHTTLWAFLPWSILFYAAVVNLFKKKNRIGLPQEIMIIWASATITFLLFSFSKFQLPHYILIILPQFSLITAVYIKNLEVKGLKVFSIVQHAVYSLVLILLMVLAIFYNFKYSFIAIGIIILIFGLAFIFYKDASMKSMIARSTFLSVGLMIFLSAFFYPALLKYESGMQAAKWLNTNYPLSKPAVLNHGEAFSFDFYVHGEPEYFWGYADLDKALAKTIKKTNTNVLSQDVPEIDINRLHIFENSLIIYASEHELPKLKADYHAEVLKSFEYYHTTKLTPKFLNAKTRTETLEKFYLVKIH